MAAAGDASGSGSDSLHKQYLQEQLQVRRAPLPRFRTPLHRAYCGVTNRHFDYSLGGRVRLFVPAGSTTPRADALAVYHKLPQLTNHTCAGQLLIVLPDCAILGCCMQYISHFSLPALTGHVLPDGRTPAGQGYAGAAGPHPPPAGCCTRAAAAGWQVSRPNGGGRSSTSARAADARNRSTRSTTGRGCFKAGRPSGGGPAVGLRPTRTIQ